MKTVYYDSDHKPSGTYHIPLKYLYTSFCSHFYKLLIYLGSFFASLMHDRIKYTTSTHIILKFLILRQIFISFKP